MVTVQAGSEPRDDHAGRVDRPALVTGRLPLTQTCTTRRVKGALGAPAPSRGRVGAVRQEGVGGR